MGLPIRFIVLTCIIRFVGLSPGINVGLSYDCRFESRRRQPVFFCALMLVFLVIGYAGLFSSYQFFSLVVMH